jgi:hypothetical protein
VEGVTNVYVQCDITAHHGSVPTLTTEDNRTVLQTVRHTISVWDITGVVLLYNLCSKNTSVVLLNSKLQSRCNHKHKHVHYCCPVLNKIRVWQFMSSGMWHWLSGWVPHGTHFAPKQIFCSLMGSDETKGSKHVITVAL